MSSEDIQALRDELAKIKAQQAKSDEAKREEFKKKYNEFKKKYPLVFKPDDDSDIDCPKGQHYDQKLGKCVPNTPPGCPELRDDGRPQPHKGASTDPKKWKVVQMADDKTLWKVVDNKNINVADQFHSEANAIRYIDHYLCTPQGPPSPPPPPPPPGPPPSGQLGPYPTTGKQIQMDVDDEAGTRHYASGKPDDRTINAKAGGIAYANYQVITDVTMKEVEHDDQVSHKLGGTHMGTGWFDHTVSFEEGETCLGKEEDHPSTDLCVETGPKIGSILNKPLKMATVYRRSTNHTELWTNFEGSGWVKQLEGTDVGGFDPGSDEDEALLRIDGFSPGGKKPGEGNVPAIRLAVVQEISTGAQPPPSPPPSPPSPPPSPPGPPSPPSPPPGPPPAPGAMDKNGIQYVFQVNGKESFDFDENFRPDGKRFDFEMLGQPGVEIGAYFKMNKNPNDEVSGKMYGGPHNDSRPEEARVYDIGLGTDGARIRLRQENEHPDYTGNLESENCNLGNLSGKWIGYRFICVNVNSNKHVRMITMVDMNGLVNGKPANNWKVIADWTDTGQYPFGPWVTYPFNSPQQTIRIDGVGGNNDLEWYGVFCRNVDGNKPLIDAVKPASMQEREALDAARTVMKEAKSPEDKEDAAKTLKKAKGSKK